MSTSRRTNENRISGRKVAVVWVLLAAVIAFEFTVVPAWLGIDITPIPYHLVHKPFILVPKEIFGVVIFGAILACVIAVFWVTAVWAVQRLRRSTKPHEGSDRP